MTTNFEFRISDFGFAAGIRATSGALGELGIRNEELGITIAPHSFWDTGGAMENSKSEIRNPKSAQDRR